MEPVRGTAGEAALDRGLLSGVAAFRWTTWAWMALVVAIDARNRTVAHLWIAVLLVALALAFTTWATVTVRTQAHRLLRPAPLIVELTLAGLLVLLDQWAYGVAHSQSLGSVWPLAAVLSIAIAAGTRQAAPAGFALGVLHWLSDLLFGAGPWTGDRAMNSWGSLVLFTLAGAVAGFVTDRLRVAERTISAARARDEVSRTLHDGVLQTLAVVQRRSDDDELVALAREQEHELREYLFGAEPEQMGAAAGLRAVAARAERQHALRAQVVVSEAPRLSDESTRALVGAVSEALTNAGKHGAATTATVYLEADAGGGAFCSVKDDGSGFDPDTTVEGVGLTRSIRGRMAEVGGRAEIDGRPGRGTEVRLWVP
jgi:signal transduction histidine kinase